MNGSWKLERTDSFLHGANSIGFILVMNQITINGDKKICKEIPVSQ